MEAISLAIFAVLVMLAWLVFRIDAGWYWVVRRRLARNDRVLREDALKYFARCEIEDEPASLRGAAGSLGVNGGAISRIVAQLAGENLLEIQGGEFRLTDSGRRYGLRMIRAHRLYEAYMSEKTGFSGSEWHERAERAEHELTEEDMHAIERALAYPSHDPHGDPIPDADGGIVQPEGAVCLDEVPPGRRCLVVHLEDEPAALFREIEAAELYPGQEIAIVSRDEGGVLVAADNGEHRLSHLAAANVQAVPRESSPAAGDASTAEADDPRAPGETLAAAPAAAPRRIRSISPRISGSERRRLMDLGFLPGTTVVKEFASAAGDPMAFRVRGSLMALRRSQAEQIFVETGGTAAAGAGTAPAAGGGS